jgi:D-alanine-D-alanine ligase
MTTSLKQVDVVLLADRSDNRQSLSLETRDLELTESDYFADLQSAISSRCRSCRHYADLPIFIDDIDQYKEAIVFSIWSGQCSRSRRALAPAVCEAYGLRYVGADAYASIICQDKYLAKRLAVRYGFSTPSCVLIEDQRQISLVRGLNLPLVSKPNNEGGSIGISCNNLTTDYKTTEELCLTLLSTLGQPVLVEEFVEGHEASVVLIGNRNALLFEEFVTLTIQSPTVDLKNTIWGYELKKLDDAPKVSYALGPDEIKRALHEPATRLFRALDKVEVIRFDGRIVDGSFELLELSPDVHFGPESTVAAAFALSGGGQYEDLISLILLNAGR